MLNYLEYECPVCHRPFLQGDDIVVCPDCGAPHHRGCWKETGNCVYADDHNTAAQWQPQPSRSDSSSTICGNCGTANLEGSSTCRKCGHSLMESSNPLQEESHQNFDATSHTAPFAPANTTQNGGNAAEQSAMDTATFIGSNSGYYLTRFQFMEAGQKGLTWNWCAAIFPVEWFLYRKMFKPFFIALAVMLILIIPSILVLVYSYQAMMGDAATLQLYWESGRLPDVNIPSWLDFISNVSFVLSLIFRGGLLLKANELYRTHVKHSMTQIRKECTDPLYYRYALSKKGGTNIAGVILYLVALAITTMIGAILLALCIL